MPITGPQFRQLMSAFPTGVAVVTTTTPEETPRGMTCSAVSSVTLTPPTILICLQQGTRTAVAVRETGTFAVNLLHSRSRAVAEVFAAPVGDRFALVDWKFSLHRLPMLWRDAFAFAECHVTDTVDVGDHTVYFGHVDVIDQVDDVPLVYGLREFGTWQPGIDVAV
jgi:flavin reductase (DIM6/NTAB) family NADH-FMN oxidoreductase RutF